MLALRSIWWMAVFVRRRLNELRAHQRQLNHNNMTSPDIRAGIAMLIAAMSAEGTSRIDHIDQIDRGYEDIEHRLNAIGAHIRRDE